jgi:SAM-dependent methyltransferase
VVYGVPFQVAMTTITSCRSCGAATLLSIVDLGETPLANALIQEADVGKEEKKFPLKLVWCSTCTLLQITENVPGDILFSNYFYRSSFSDAFLKHCEELSQKILKERKLKEESLVIDIASNDGYLLQFYKKQGIQVLGVEPAKNIAEIAVKNGIDTRNTFFTAALAATLPKADILHAHNVLPHVENQKDFVEGMRNCLKQDGVAIIEFAYAIDTIEKTEFDQIYHEHMCYFSLTSFKNLVEQCGLVVTNVEKIDVHGGSLRICLMHKGSKPEQSVETLLKEEEVWGVKTEARYREFATRVLTLKHELTKLLQRKKDEGKTIVAYGASAKGATLMNFCGIGKELLEYVVDRSTMKQGLYTPGTHLKIELVEKLLEDQPDFVLLLTWNFAEEILSQQDEYRRKGGQFIVPVPSPKIV